MNIRVLVSIAVLITGSAVADTDPASEQLVRYKNKTKNYIGYLTKSNGARVEIKETSSYEIPDLMENEYFMETMSHKVMQRIPERVVHPKGGGAFGYFNVTHDLTDLCKADLFKHIGKITPVAVRFSPANSEKGEADTARDGRGFAVKFYTKEGNLDIPGFNTPMFFLKDPGLFSFVSNVFKRNPATNLKDSNMVWDFMANNPETINFILYLFGDNGIPDGYIHMPGFGIHLYQIYNSLGISSFARVRFYPNAGIKNLFLEEATTIGCSDPDYYNRGLYNAIENRDYPSWKVQMQILSLEDVNNCTFDPFDITRTLPEEIYPYRDLGELVLNRNPKNNFAEMEQLAFCPGNLVDGFVGSPDLVFKARRFSYKAAERYRLGSNFHNIDVNKPLNKALTYSRDGVPPVGSNGEDAPNYYPNSFNGPVPYVDKNKPKLLKIKQVDTSRDFEEATQRYNKLSSDERQRLAANIVASLSLASKIVQEKIIAVFKLVHSELAFDITTALAKTSKR